MPIATRTFRVFVSSTFEDLKEERDALQRDVFPKLRTLCEQHGARFQAIDLRWGVRDEAGLDQQTMEICLREIQRCRATGVRPNFIALLGDRYGWQPLPARIPATEFDALNPHLPSGDVVARAERWYRLDENAVPPEYCLQPRTGEFVDRDVWSPVEQKLHEALAKAARAASLPAKELIKYEASATHQEILAGLGDSVEDRQHVFGFVRRPTGNTDPRLEELKSHLRVHEFEPGDIKGLCALVLAQLSAVIGQEGKRFEDRPALDLEIEAHDRFAEDRSRIFIGRDAVLKAIADYVRGPERQPLVLHGESGSGKSAVIAKASQQYNGPGRLIRRFIGTSPESASGHALLTSLCRQIAPGETPVDYAQLENAFRERLSVASADQPLVLFIDALDQLTASDPARDVTWLPQELPPHVKVIVSTASTNADGERLPEGVPVRLERMAQSEGGLALDELLREARRTLQPWQRENVLEYFERCGLPLYLKLAAEESRLWKSYTSEDACVLSEGVGGIIDTLFGRLASNANHGPTLVEHSLGYLAAARYGLTEDEVLDVLTADDAVWNDFDKRKRHEVSERRLPVVVWSRLSLDLEPYLTERAAPGGTVIAFYHRQLAERVAGRFLAGPELQARHSDLAHYFLGRPVPDRRRLVELVFQQRGAEQWAKAEATLFDTQFLFAKVAAGMVQDLDADYQALLEEAPERSLPRREALRLVHGALRLSLHVLTKDPSQFASQMVGRLVPYRDEEGIREFVERIGMGASRPWLLPLAPALTPPGMGLIRTLVGHTYHVRGVALSADGKVVISACDDRTLKVWDVESGRELRTFTGHTAPVLGVAVSADGRVAVSASSDGTLRVWDVARGRERRTFQGQTGGVHAVALSADGKVVVWPSDDRTLTVSDLENGLVLHTLSGHTAPVLGVAVSADGKVAVSASREHTLRVWDLARGRELPSLRAHTAAVLGVALSADGKVAVSASKDRTLRVWDVARGWELHRLAGHADNVQGVALSADGRVAVSASDDRTLKVWDVASGRELNTLAGHTDWVLGVALSADGRVAVSGSFDHTLKVWDVARGRDRHPLQGHTKPVNGIAVSADGRAVVSVSDDRTLKVWDVQRGQERRVIDRIGGRGLRTALNADGNVAISESDDQTLKVWDVESGRERRILLQGRHGEGVGVAISADGQVAVSASSGGILVWDLATGRLVDTLNGHTAPVLGVAMSADGNVAVSASSDDTLKVWDLESARLLHSLTGHTAYVRSTSVSADGLVAVSGSDDGMLKVWDVAHGRERRTIHGHTNLVNGVALSADGEVAVSASKDRTLKVWDVESGTCLATFSCEGPANCCAVAVGVIAAGDAAGRIYFLALEK